MLLKSFWEVLKGRKRWNPRGSRLELWKTSFNSTSYSAALPFYWAEHIFSPAFCFIFPLIPLDIFHIFYWQTKSFPYYDKNIPSCINFTTHLKKKLYIPLSSLSVSALVSIYCKEFYFALHSLFLELEKFYRKQSTV